MAKKTIAKKKKKVPVPQENTATSYWNEFLKDFNSSAKLWLEGFDIPLSLADNHDNDHYSIKKIDFPKHIAKSLYHYSKKNHLSISLILQAAWSILLNRYTGSDDIIYGQGWYANINHAKKITIFPTLLPVRSQIKEQESLAAYIQGLKIQLQQSSKYRSEFKKITQQRDTLYHYAFLSKKSAPLKKSSVSMADPKQLSLIFSLIKEKPLTMAFVFNVNKFTQNSIHKLIQHFILVTEKIISDPEADVAHFSILTASEKRKLLNKWSKPIHSSMPPPAPTTGVHDLFAMQAQERPDRLAVASSKYSLTYRELDEKSNQLAHTLLVNNVKKTDIVAVLMDRTPALLVAMLAIFKIGAIYVPMNPKYPDDRIQFILNDCAPTCILVNTIERIPKDQHAKTVIVDDSYQRLSALDTQHTPSTTTANQVAYIIYTSGTTGQPKGVMIRHQSLINLSHWYHTIFSITPEDRASQFASQAFDSFFCETIPFLCTGASVHIIDDHDKLIPATLLRWLASEHITVCDLPTAYAQVLFNMLWPDNLSLRLIKIGGESLSHYPDKVFSFDIWNTYGPTEATVETTYIKIHQKNTPLEKQPYHHLPPPIGKPIVNAEIYIVDQHLEPVPIGDVGELLIGGAGISLGYLNRKQLTRTKFIRNIFNASSEEKLYRTGDLARWLDDGNLEFIGRVDHQIKVRGYRIELSEVESTIRQYPDVQEIVVLAKEMITGQKTLCAYLVPNLDKIRIPYHERCLVANSDSEFVEAATDDISKEGLAITRFSGNVKPGQVIRIHLRLPGSSDPLWLSGKVVWQQEERTGIAFENNSKQKKLLDKSIKYYLATHNLMETLHSAATQRSIRQALKRKLPDYMIPTVFTLLPQFPLTFNGKIDWKSLPPPHDFERLLDRQYVAPRTETEKIIADIWGDILNLKQISVTDNFFDLGGNSLLVSQLSIKILQQFNLSIPLKLFFDLPFIPILAEYIDSNGQQYTVQSNIQDEINHDSILPDEIEPPLAHEDFKNPRGVLLTGAAGFLGIYLLRELILQTDAKIYCIIRKGQFDSPAKRLMENIHHYGLEEDITLANRRIVIITGDISLDQFGIPSENYENLAEKIDAIIHCGAQVNTMASYVTVRNSNVQGTLEVIKFATHKISKAIHYVSTLSAAYKKDAYGNFTEEFPDADLGNLVGGYAISKWVSERLLTQIKNRGLPISIYRSGYILGQSDTGITNFNDALLLLIKGCIQLGYAPDWKETISILPVDFVSKSMIAIAFLHPENSQVYHLDHPNGILWNDLIAWLNNYGFPIKHCSHTEWRLMLMQITPENALYHFLPYYLSLENEPVTPGTNIEHTKHLLREIGLEFPTIDDHLLRLYMNYLCETGFFPTPEPKILT